MGDLFLYTLILFIKARVSDIGMRGQFVHNPNEQAVGGSAGPAVARRHSYWIAVALCHRKRWAPIDLSDAMDGGVSHLLCDTRMSWLTRFP